MDDKQLQAIETELIKRGYKKYIYSLTSNETYAWYKAFPKELDIDGEATDGYQIAFRVWDFRQFKYAPDGCKYGFDFYTAIVGCPERIEMSASWDESKTIADFEKIAEDFHRLTNGLASKL